MARLKELKARAQLLEPIVRVGKAGLSDAVVIEIESALKSRELIKIRFDHERDERAALAGRILEITGAQLVMQVGKVAVFYRPKPTNSTASA